VSINEQLLTADRAIVFLLVFFCFIGGIYAAEEKNSSIIPSEHQRSS